VSIQSAWARPILINSTPTESTYKAPHSSLKQSYFRGWDYLVTKLREDGVSETQIKQVYQDKRMPKHSFIPFAVRPRETHAMYAHFNSAEKILRAEEFLNRHRNLFEEAESRFSVSRYIIGAIFLVETQLGRVTGKQLIVNRLSRLGAIDEPKNVHLNYLRLKKDDSTVSFDAVQDRARYLEDTFYPEITALLELARQQKLDVLSLQGSIAGAFGIPQFLPSSALRFGVDANQDGVVSLFHEADAIWSTANYLANSGWRDSLSHEERRSVIWKYNHSDAYVDTVLKLAKELGLTNAS
jgi:membrane-bound lytic murein transglycosylase B